jgi:hypothetical protein
MYEKTQYIIKYCDIQTNDGVWRLGIINKNVNFKNLLEIHLDGWSENKKQVINIYLESLYTFGENPTTPVLFERLYRTEYPNTVC